MNASSNHAASNSKDARDEFFVGYAATPPATARFLIKTTAGILASAFALALVLGWGMQERGAGNYGDTLATRGVLQMVPYPVLRTAPDATHPNGRAILVAGDGKIGAAETVASAKGQLVEASGAMLKRGDLDMMIIDTASVKPVSSAQPQLSAPVSLGRWRIAGEICDGKCYAGAMRPGTGLSHKACANLCIMGGQAAVLATVRPIEGASFLLLADKDGKIPPARMYDLVALPVEMEGEVFRLNDLLIFHADWQSVKTQ